MSFISTQDWQALLLSLKLSTLTTLILLVFGLPLAWWLSKTRSLLKPVIETLVCMPIVLPPTVLGFYILISMGANSMIGQWWYQLTGHPIVFTFTGLLISSVIYSLPFVVQPLQNCFHNLPQQPFRLAAVLGASPIDRFFSIFLPYTRTGILTACILGFTHTMGEFGVVLMIGGNIPGSTQVVSIAIYDHVEQMQYANAYHLSLILLIFSFITLLVTYSFNQQSKVKLF